MGMSTEVVGIKPPDEKWKQMKAVYDSCKAAGVETPMEVSEFFGFDPPDDAGVLVEMAHMSDPRHPKIKFTAVTPYSDDSGNGFEVVLAKVDPEIKVLRFVNRW